MTRQEVTRAMRRAPVVCVDKVQMLEVLPRWLRSHHRSRWDRKQVSSGGSISSTLSPG